MMRLKGTTILLSGDFDDRAGLVARLRERGAVLVDQISPGVEFVFEGASPGSVVDTAREMGVRVRGMDVLNAALSAGEPDERPLPPSDAIVFMDDEAPPAYLMDAPPPPDSKPRSRSNPPDQKTETPKNAEGVRIFEKGARVRIIGGREGVGLVGEIFWWGDSKFGDGMRAGVEVTRDQKFWVDEAHLGWPEETADIKAPEGPVMGKGTRVRVISGKERGIEGVIFWWGTSRYGSGMRAGLEDAKGDKYFIDDEFLEVVPDAAATSDAPVIDEDIPF